LDTLLWMFYSAQQYLPLVTHILNRVYKCIYETQISIKILRRKYPIVNFYLFSRIYKVIFIDLISNNGVWKIKTKMTLFSFR
jgi:hypothetical protein